MRRLLKWVIILGLFGLAVWGASMQAMSYWKERTRVRFQDGEVSRGTIVAVVNSTGTIKPVRSVQVGAFVSGPIEEIHVDFNAEVKKGDLLATIDPRLYIANVDRDKANLATREAEVLRVEALLQQAKNDEARSKKLRAESQDFISDAEMDQFKFNRMSLEAQLAVAKTSIQQAQASLDNSNANLEYTKITAPVDGVIIDRKVDPGQTVASQFQTPELFTVAPDMRKEMQVYASVDEADIGLITDAQSTGQPVRFTVDAYPDDLFEGKIAQIRRNSTTTQNVVTYPVIVSAPNPELKLLPGMTASLSFQVGQVKDVLRVPNTALRFYPKVEQVRPEDRPLLEGSAVASPTEETTDIARSAEEKAEIRRRRFRRHVWVQDGELLRAVAVQTGLSDSSFTEVVSGDLAEGRKVVIGIQPNR